MKQLSLILISILFIQCNSVKDETEIGVDDILAIDTLLTIYEVEDSVSTPEFIEKPVPMVILVSVSDTHTINIEYPMFTVLVPNTFYDEGDVNEIVLRENESLLTIELFQMFNGSTMDVPFNVVPKESDFELTKVEQQYSSTLMFNEDGSGGVWEISEVTPIESNWIELGHLKNGSYHTLPKDTLFEFPEMSQESIIAAEVYISGKEWPTTYSKEINANRLRFSWVQDGEEKQAVVSFQLVWGD